MTDPTEFKFDHKGIAVTVKPKAADIAGFFYEGRKICIALDPGGIPRGRAWERVQSLCQGEVEELNRQLQLERAKHATALNVTQTEHIQGFEVSIAARQDGDEDVRLTKGGDWARTPRDVDGRVRLTGIQMAHIDMSPEALKAVNERLAHVDFGDSEAPETVRPHEDPGPLGKRVQVLLKSGTQYNGIVQSFDRDGLTLIQEPKPHVTHNAFYFPMSSVDYLVWPVKGES